MISLLQLLKEVQGKPKALILAGAPGAGKGTVLGDLDLKGLKVFNLDDTILALSKAEGFSLNQKDTDVENRSAFMKAMATATSQLKGNPKKGIKGDIPQAIEDKESFILDGTSASYTQTKKLVDQLNEAGYDVMMLYVYVDLETSLQRNEKRFEKSGGEDRSLMPSAVYRTWLQVAKNFDEYQQLFGDNFVPFSNVKGGETMKNVENILQTYIQPWKPKDAQPKTEKEIERSRKQAIKLNQEMQDFLNSDATKNIINNSYSKEEAQSKINGFLN